METQPSDFARAKRVDLRIQAPIWIIATYVLIQSMQVASSILLWVVCSMILYVLIEPSVRFLTRKGLPAFVAVLGIVLMVVLFFGAIGILANGKSAEIREAVSAYKDTIIRVYNQINTTLNQLWLSSSGKVGSASDAAVPVAKATKVQVVNSSGIGETLIGGALPHVGSFAEGVAYFFLCPILTFFFFAEQSSIRRAFERLVPNAEIRTLWWTDVCRAIQAYFLGNLMLALASWPVFAVVFYFFDIESWPLFSFMAALLNIIPFVGALFAAAFPILEHLSLGGSLPAALAILLSSFLIHFLIANLVTPKILGSKVDLNAWVSTIAIVAWGSIWGAAGLLLAVPLTAVIKISFQYSESGVLRWISLLMSDDQESWIQRSRVTSALRNLGTSIRSRGTTPEPSLPLEPKSNPPEPSIQPLE